MRNQALLLARIIVTALFLSLPASPPLSAAEFIRGDANGDGRVDLTDAVYTFGYLFLSEPSALDCRDAADSDDSSVIDLTDGLFTLSFIFMGGREPPPPGPFRCGPDPTRDELSCERFSPCRSGFETGRWVTRNADGSLHGVIETRPGSSLFSVPSHGEALLAFRRWVLENAGEFGLEPPGKTLTLDELVPAARPWAQAGKATVFHFVQTYRGLEVVGPQRTVSLSTRVDPESANGLLAVSFTGTILDPRVEYRGLGFKHLAQREAAAALKAAWLAVSPQDGGPVPSDLHTIEDVSLVALPQKRAIAFRGEVLDDTASIARIYVGAVDGRFIGYEVTTRADAFDHRPVTILAHEISDNPDTTEIYATHGHRGSTRENRCPPPEEGGCFLRMGDDRVSVWNFEGDPSSSPTVAFTYEYQHVSGNPFSAFIANDPDNLQFITQDLFQKLDLGLSVLDPIKLKFGWDHNPQAPFGISKPAPVSLFVNIPTSTCGGNVGKAGEQTFGGDWGDVGHPYAGVGYPTSTLLVCNQRVTSLLHETGHYCDLHSAYGFLGDGLLADSCVWDTPDEAIPLAETLADMVRLFLYRKVYPGLDYTLSATDAPCEFDAVGSGSVDVHGPSCERTPRQFDEDRPGPSASEPCNSTVGYWMGSMHQACWKYLHGKLCNEAGNCTNVSPKPSIDSFMEAIYYALSLGNLQSYKQFFEHMASYLAMDHGAEAEDFFRTTLRLHGLLD